MDKITTIGKLNFISGGILLLNMRANIDTLHKELREIKTEVNKLNVLLQDVFMDREGRLNKTALKQLIKARNTPDEEYIPHEEVERWFGKLSGTRRRSKH